MSKIKSSQINGQNLEWLLAQPLNIQLELMSHHLEICRIVVRSILEGEVNELAGDRYSHAKPNDGRYVRWGSNPGSVRLGHQKIRVKVPRVMDQLENRSVPLESYAGLHTLPDPDATVVASILHGLSTRDYGQVVDRLYDSFGLSSASLSRRFSEESRQALEAFEQRRFEHQTFVALYLDGKSLSDRQMLVVMGVTEQGEKVVLGIAQTASENSKAVAQLLREIVERDFSYEEGLLCIVDGAKGIKKALKEVFGLAAVIQRCQWHKRENILSYLPQSEQSGTNDGSTKLFIIF